MERMQKEAACLGQGDYLIERDGALLRVANVEYPKQGTVVVHFDQDGMVSIAPLKLRSRTLVEYC